MPSRVSPWMSWAAARRWTTVAALLLVAACSKDKDIDQPAQLTPFDATIRVERAWSAGIADKGGAALRLGLGLAVEGNRVFGAGHTGEVAAFDLSTGRMVWRKPTKAALSGGPGVGAGLVVVGSSQGVIVALDETDGAIRWKTQLNGEVLSAPAVSERLVAVRTVDGKLHGLSAKDGHELWSQDQAVPRLSLRGTAWPVLTGDLVLCGFDNGKVAALNVNDGTVQWETTIAPAHGKTELERLDDIDAGVRVSGADVYAVGFQGRVAMLALDTGQIWWSHDASSYRGMGLDDNALYVATADGQVVAMRRRTGAELWRQKALLHRRLSAAVETDNAIVTGDFQGQVHWLDKATGALAARASTGKVRISNPPVAVGNMVLVVNDAGKITAFRTSPIGGSAKSSAKKSATPAESTATPVEPGAAPAGSSSSPAEPGSTPPGTGSATSESGAASSESAPAPQAVQPEQPPATTTPEQQPGQPAETPAPEQQTTPAPAEPTTPAPKRPSPLPQNPLPQMPQTSPQPPPS